MTGLTTMKVSSETRDELKAIAERDQVTLEGVLRKLLRLERQRLIGEELAARSPGVSDVVVARASSAAVSRAIG